jgi:hypothetical protein
MLRETGVSEGDRRADLVEIGDVDGEQFVSLVVGADVEGFHGVIVGVYDVEKIGALASEGVNGDAGNFDFAKSVGIR